MSRLLPFAPTMARPISDRAPGPKSHHTATVVKVTIARRPGNAGYNGTEAKDYQTLTKLERDASHGFPCLTLSFVLNKQTALPHLTHKTLHLRHA